MLTITYESPTAGRQTRRVDLDGDAFHTTAHSFGLEVTTTPDETMIRVTGESDMLASFFADLRASGIEHVTVSRGRGDGDAEDGFCAVLDDLGIEVEIVRTL